MKTGTRILAALLSLALIFSLAACSSSDDGAKEAEGSSSSQNQDGTDGNSSDNSEAREIVVAVAPGYYPITYADEDGKAAGYDVAVFEAVDALLDDYTFVYEIADKETMNVGVQTGTYQAGINSLFKTETRIETYLLPETNMGYTAVGIVQREDSNYNSIQDLFDTGASITPTLAAGGIGLVVNKWNSENPDCPINVELLSNVSDSDMLAAIQAGEYDAMINLIPVYNLLNPEAVTGLKISDPVYVMPTYPIINKDEEDLAAQVEEALKTLTGDGTLSSLSIEYFGYDVFAI